MKPPAVDLRKTVLSQLKECTTFKTGAIWREQKYWQPENLWVIWKDVVSSAN